MLLNIYLFLTVVAIGLVALSFYSKNALLWAVTFCLSGILAVTSYSVEMLEYQYQSSTLSYAPTLQSYSYIYMSVLFIGMGGIALMYFYLDLMDLIKNRHNIEEAGKR